MRPLTVARRSTVLRKQPELIPQGLEIERDGGAHGDGDARRVFGNGNLLQQVMMNLILNAFHATAPGGEVRVILCFEQAEALLSVCDTGRGISPGHLPKIFDPFFTTQPVGQGTGLGLSICHTIIKQHGGSISVESTEGLGSTFTIRLPVSEGSKVTW